MDGWWIYGRVDGWMDGREGGGQMDEQVDEMRTQSCVIHNHSHYSKFMIFEIGHQSVPIRRSLCPISNTAYIQTQA
jgi:hypothetical protein